MLVALAVIASALVRRRRDVADLKADADRLHQALIGSGQGLYDVDLVSGEVVISPEYALMLGYDPADFTETFDRVLARIHPDDRAQALQQLENYLSGRSDRYRNEFRLRTRDDGWLWVLSCGRVVERDAEGKPLRMIGTHKDISERKRAEEMLRVSSEEIDRYFDMSLDLLCILDTDGCFRKLNSEWEALSGNRIADLEGRLLFEMLHPDDLDITLEAFQRLANQTYVTDLANRFRCRDGSFRWLEWRCRPAGKSVYAVARDVTRRVDAEDALQESQRTFMAFLESAPGITYIKDRQRRHLFVNRKLADFIGIEGASWLGRTFEEILPGADAENIRVHDEQVLETGKVQRQEEMITIQGTKRIFSSVKFPIVTSDRETLLGGISLDISEEKSRERELELYRTRLEDLVASRTAELEQSQKALLNLADDLNQTADELRESNDRLLELDRLKSLFVASVSHELRTPLNAIIGFSSILSRAQAGPLNGEQRRHVDAILRSGKHLLALINDIIDISRIEADRLVPRYEEFSLDAVVAEVVDLVAEEARKKGLELRVDVPPISMYSDPQRLGQCLLNLLGNAIKYTDEGSVTLRADSRKEKRAPATVRIEVADTGIGIAAEDLPRLFEAFGRLAPSHKASGTGLGLYLTHRLVTGILQGEIDVASEPEQGSRFRLTLPERVDETEQADRSEHEDPDR